ncbi:MAG: hypothetical protein ABW213_11055, partial [Tardiphaga sp.]
MKTARIGTVRSTTGDRDERRENAKDGARFALCDHAGAGFNRHLRPDRVIATRWSGPRMMLLPGT